MLLTKEPYLLRRRQLERTHCHEPSCPQQCSEASAQPEKPSAALRTKLVLTQEPIKQ